MSELVDNLYKRNQDLKKEDIQILQEWLEKQPHLPKVTELQLILFLHSCYYRLEPAKAAIDNFFTIRALCPDLFGCATKDVIEHTMGMSVFKVLPQQTSEGYDVLLCRITDVAPEKYIFLNQAKLTDMALMLHLKQHGTSNGLVVVLDMKGSVFGHLARVNLMVLKKFLYYLQEAAPVRIKAIHIINPRPFTDKLLSMVKPFMKKELFEMLFVHSDSMDTFYKYVAKESLPEDYGGSEVSIQLTQEQVLKSLSDNVDFFKSLESQKVDESKRAGKPKNEGDIFGVEGSFKKLQVD